MLLIQFVSVCYKVYVSGTWHYIIWHTWPGLVVTFMSDLAPITLTLITNELGSSVLDAVFLPKLPQEEQFPSPQFILNHHKGRTLLSLCKFSISALNKTYM